MDKILRRLNMRNPDLGIHPVEGIEFQSYGRVFSNVPMESVLASLSRFSRGNGLEVAAHLDLPKEAKSELQGLTGEIFSSADLQFCAIYGRNTKLNALEYHKSSELMVAEFSIILLAGLVCEIEWPRGVYDLSRIQAFYVPAGTIVEIHPWCLRCNPVHVFQEEGFRCLAVLPRGTNLPLDTPPGIKGESMMMLGRNRWLLAHQDDPSDYGMDAHHGLVGRNIELNTL